MTNEEFLKKIGLQIAERRKKKNLTQQELAELVGLKRTAITRIELGNTNFGLLTLKAISEALGTPVAKLIT